MEAEDDLKGMLREFMEESRREHAVTRAELRQEFRQELGTAVGTLRQEFRQDLGTAVGTLRTELRLEMGETRTQLHAHIDEAKRQLGGEIDALKPRFDLLADGIQNLDQKIDREAADIRNEMRTGFANTEALIRFSHADLEKRRR
jgi:hypothetical protein